jgi:cellulose synthase operon protein YhjQ
MPVLCFASPKGGVGKTTLAAAVAHALAIAGHRVIAVDFDDQNALGLHFGMALDDADGFVTGLSKARDMRSAWRSALRTGPGNLQYLPHGRVGLRETLAFARAVSDAPRLITGPLADMLDDGERVVVIDLPPGASPVLSAVLPIATMLICVLAADTSSMALMPAIENGSVFGDIECQTSIVLNLLDMRSRVGRASWEAAAKHLGNRLLGTVYRDESVREASAMQLLVGDHAPDSKASADIAALAREIGRRLAPAPRGAHRLSEVA